MVQQNVRQSELFVAENWEAAFQAFQNINFQSYSFTTIKQAMLNYIQQTYPEDFTDWSQSSEFMFTVDLLAYLGETLAYRVDLNSRDNILDTATRTQSIINMVSMLNYNIHRNQCASGLVKLNSVTTTQNVFDSNGNNLSNQIILWNDPSNSDWYEQFIIVLNASFVPTNQFGNPVQSTIINNIPSQLYALNNITGQSAAAAFSIPVSGQGMDFEIVNPTFNATTGTISELNPNPNNQQNIIYMNDGSGYTSANTGFFLYFKQGSLKYEDYLFDLAVVSRQLPITSTNINDTDVWVSQVDDNGNDIADWVEVDNLVYNDEPNTVRNLFGVITNVNDQITVAFGDGNFSTIPTGNFRIWYRQSNGLVYTIKPVDMRGVVVNYPYTSNSLNATTQQFNLTLNFSLQQAVDNSSATETIQSAQTNAAAVYYTQNRMVNGEDYNSFPLNQGQAIVKMKAVNRTYSGHSQFYDILDPTKIYSSTIEFGDDGVLYEQYYQGVTNVPLPTNLSLSEILQQDIEPLLLNPDYQVFYYANNTQFTLNNLYWGLVDSNTGSSTGFLVNASNVPQVVGMGAAGTNQYIGAGSMIQFINPLVPTQTMWAFIESIYGNGTQFTATNDGAISLSSVVPNGWVASLVYAPFRDVLLPLEAQNVLTQLSQNNTFGIRYNLETASWVIITSSNIDLTDPFSLEYAGDQTNNNLDSSWIISAQYSPSGWVFTVRYMRYVFESIERSRFFLSPETKAINIENNTVEYDTITVLQFNTQPYSSLPLGENFPFQVSQAIRYADGFVEPRRVQVIPADLNEDGAFDNPNAFMEVVAPNPTNPLSYVFQEMMIDALGFDFYQIIDPSLIMEFVDPAALVANITWANGNVAFVVSTNQFFQYTDGAITPMSFNQTNSTIVYPNHGMTTGNQIELFLNPPPIGVLNLPTPLQFRVLYYVYVVDNNTLMLGTSLEDVTASVPSLITFTSASVGTLSVLQEITNTGNYLAFLGRQNLNYSYEHFSDQDERLDPSITNVIDMYILTSGYYNEVLTWLNSQDQGPFPVAPTSFDLEQQFADLQDFKMISDDLIFQPAQFNLLFGTGAVPQLQGTFMVVRASQTNVTDNEIKQAVITAINNFFDISQDRFDFGESFYFTELCAYIHQQLATMISSVVIVPTYGPSSFGDLFQVRCDVDQLFLSTATVANVQIVNALTSTVLRISGPGAV
jgi:hypothetical protein